MKKKIILLGMCMAVAGYTFAQKDSVVIVKSNDTVRIGGVIILKENDSTKSSRLVISVGDNAPKKQTNLSTSTVIVDLGFSNWSDRTDYVGANAADVLVNRPGSSALNAKDFKLRTGKSINVNVWVIAQKLNLINHYVNLKYALGVQLNNYRFKSNISFSDGGLNPYDPSRDISHAFVFRDSVSFSKNKLAADYVTIPLMLNFNTNPNGKEFGLNLSAGVSIGYLFSSRNKQVSNEHGKMKDHGTYDLRKWKLAYEADLGIGKTVSIYGSYSPESIFKNELNFHPYTIGLRLLTNRW